MLMVKSGEKQERMDAEYVVRLGTNGVFKLANTGLVEPLLAERTNTMQCQAPGRFELPPSSLARTFPSAQHSSSVPRSTTFSLDDLPHRSSAHHLLRNPASAIPYRKPNLFIKPKPLPFA